MSKILGIDLGTKRIGIALSNIERTFAFPLKVIETKNISKNLTAITDEIVDIAKTENISEILIGESKNFKGIDNPIMEQVRIVQNILKEKGFKVELEPEFMTSEEASRHQGKGSLIDASAAAIILQSYLDRLFKSNNA